MHRAGYEALGLPFVYAPFAVDAGDLPAALEGMRALGIRGLGVSMPFKIQVLPLLDAIAPTAKRIGAVNTIVNDERMLTGHNTDAIGAVRAFEEASLVEGRRCLLLGAGGAARAVAVALAERGAFLTIANRDHERARELAELTGAASLDWHAATKRAGEFDALVNATSVGMNVDGPSVCPVDPGTLRSGMIVMDIVYKPLETALVVAARRAGAKVVHGGRMLLHQAAAQFELYTGHEAPLEAMDLALRATPG